MGIGNVIALFAGTAITLCCKDSPITAAVRVEETSERPASRSELDELGPLGQRQVELKPQVGRPGTATAIASCNARVDPAQALAAARAWLEALKERDAGRLAYSTWFPLRCDTTARKKRCEGTVGEPAALSDWLHCLVRTEKLLMGELSRGEHPDLDFEVVTVRKVPKSLQPLIGKPGPEAQLVSMGINGDGVTFEFVFIVCSGNEKGGARVRAFLMNEEIELL